MAYGQLSTGLLRNPEHLAALRADTEPVPSPRYTAAAPPTISESSVVIAACRALL